MFQILTLWGVDYYMSPILTFSFLSLGPQYYMSVVARQSYVSYMYITLLVARHINICLASRGLIDETFATCTLTPDDFLKMRHNYATLHQMIWHAPNNSNK